MSEGNPSPLESAREIRRGVRAAMVAVESAAATSARGAGWTGILAKQLDALSGAFDHHIAVTEAEAGLLNETLELAPRLARRARQLRDEHVEIAALITNAMLNAESGGEADEARADELRKAVTDIIVRISRHRQIGADLVYEAYNVDIEGGG